jgi:hypothetical protein
MSSKPTSVRNKEVELQRIQALQNYFQTIFNAQYSLVIGFIVGYLILLISLYYQGVFNILPEPTPNELARIGDLLIFLLILIGPSLYIRSTMLERINRQNERCLTVVEDLLNKVESGEPIGSLLDLKKLVNQEKEKSQNTKSEKTEPDKPKPEEPKKTEPENRTTDQTQEKRRKWLSIESLTLIALLISTGFTVYFAWRSDNLQNSLNSLTYFQPFIFSTNATSTLPSSYCARNDTVASLIGLVAVNLKVVTPYDGMLTINVKTLDVTNINELNSKLDMNNSGNLNYSIHSPSYLGTTIPQYFISRNVINSIEDKLLVRLTVILEANWISPSSNATGFELGNLTFEANLFAVQTNQTMTQTFYEDVVGMFTPTS